MRGICHLPTLFWQVLSLFLAREILSRTRTRTKNRKNKEIDQECERNQEKYINHGQATRGPVRWHIMIVYYDCLIIYVRMCSWHLLGFVLCWFYIFYICLLHIEFIKTLDHFIIVASMFVLPIEPIPSGVKPPLL